MFDNFEKLGDGIYLLKNFLSNEECTKIVSILDSYTGWISEGFEQTMSRTDGNIKELCDVRDKLKSLIPEEYSLGISTAGVKMTKGQFWLVHEDVSDFFDILEASKAYQDGQNFVEKDLSIYGTVVYFNEFVGGEIFYPDQNIVYLPSPGDLVIHKSDNTCRHGVKEVISEKRYSYSNHISKKVRIPA
jgi:hypothetical protein